MEENEKNLNAEELKKETADAVNQVRETIKNVDVKNDAREATGFATSMFKDPFGTIKTILDDSSNKHFKTAIIFVAIWTIVVFIKALSIKYWSFNALFRNVLSLVKTIIAPALGIVVLSGVIYFVNKKNKKSLVTIMTAVTTAKIPVIVAAVINLLTIFASSASKITTPISRICSAISIVLTYFTVKNVLGEEDNTSAFRKFVIVEAIYYVAYILISFLEIYI